ncbi:MAG: TAT-variant-translocated molybdopterin oxidoreductase [Phycisphaerales bacterium]|nr:MAG: TAT-variant-translocated molybdopterin oxidoreductase [Phycisphaerales bacterium]
MPPLTTPTSGPTYWRSLDELADTPEFHKFVEGEFPNLTRQLPDSATRRQFLKLMGASLALGGMTGCRWPEEQIAAYANRPEGRTPGVPVRYATAMELGGVAAGLLVTSYDGRPIKIEGNPLHPINRGATDAFAQASVLELYDPDRSKSVIHRDGSQTLHRTWDEFAAFARSHFQPVRDREGAGLYILSESTSSPSLMAMRARVMDALPQAKWFEYEPISRDNERQGLAMVFRRPYRPHFALDRANAIVCLDADLLMNHPAAIKHARDFTAGRQVDHHGERPDGRGSMNRLYVVESSYTVTGGMADHRYPVRSADVAMIAVHLAAELKARGLRIPFWQPARGSRPGTTPGASAAKLDGTLPPDSLRPPIASIADELADHRGRCLIAVGPRQPAEVHALVCALNQALANVGRAVTYTAEPDPDRPTHLEAIASLTADLEAGQVDTVMILGGNPVYDAPADLEFGRLLASAKTSIHLGLHRNETSRSCAWHVPRAHYLETWGDARAYDGTVSIIQPLIRPLYEGKTPCEMLAMMLNEEPANAYDIVRRTFQQFHGDRDFETSWRRALHDGVVEDTRWRTSGPPVRNGTWVARLRERVKETAAKREEMEVVFRPDAGVYDGRFANNGWLQELPDPLTKLTWDNAALISPMMAEALDVKTGDMISLRVDGRKLEIAAYVMPGQAPGSMTLPLGYGRWAAGQVGNATGFNTYMLRTTSAMDFAAGAEVTKISRHYKLATTQDHHAIASAVGRRETQSRLGTLIREATVDDYTDDPEFAKHAVHHPPLVSLWEEHKYDRGHQWAMAIDLGVCTGCSACVLACQAENNIPVVGKEEVSRGREMHWIRVDRYFKGEPWAPQLACQPVTCHQCENAPCEQVCPVAATAHSKEGLNDMVYNRCIGTRYCSNNCPYKVRRFNWFNNHKDLTEIEKMIFNPEVTVRSRGVMEKCTYCVQRISAAKIAAKNERRTIRDGEITPACAQVCPTRAIVFGDLNDSASRVAKLHAADRAYTMLAELNVKPRTKYLARLRNPAGWAATQRESDNKHPT